MNKTPCENVGYEAGDKFVLLSDAGPLPKGTMVEANGAGRMDGGLDIFKCFGSAFWLDPLKMQKLDRDGWIEWAGGGAPVDRNTLVDIKYRDWGVSFGCAAGNYTWSNRGSGWDVIAYRLHKPEQQSEVNVVIDATRHAQPTIDQLLQAWQQAKAHTQRAEQDEADARKALDDALRSAGYDKVCDGVPKEEALNITDWRDLKPGDIIWWEGDRDNKSGEYTVTFVEPADYTRPLQVRVGSDIGNPSGWMAATAEQWHFIRRPA
ncbi:hypothetical protein ACNJKD_01745 [Edwardsiella tarda]|uniref:hypothetical protein n=1 Tax=Edwardsiella tarda TaxID=636 RepID=UPI003A89B018